MMGGDAAASSLSAAAIAGRAAAPRPFAGRSLAEGGR
jgi:hypothetical protein